MLVEFIYCKPTYFTTRVYFQTNIKFSKIKCRKGLFKKFLDKFENVIVIVV